MDAPNTKYTSTAVAPLPPRKIFFAQVTLLLALVIIFIFALIVLDRREQTVATSTQETTPPPQTTIQRTSVPTTLNQLQIEPFTEAAEKPATTLTPTPSSDTATEVQTSQTENTSTPAPDQTPVVTKPAITPPQNATDAFSPVNGKKVIWGDNFDTLDTTRWKQETLSTYGDGNNEIQCYMPENIQTKNGQLILTARKKTQSCPTSTRQYTSGMVRSRGVEFAPGQGIEFRVKLTPADTANQEGLWPAVWSSSFGGGGWPLGGELDFLEMMTAHGNNKPIFSAHYKKSDGSKGISNQVKKLDQPFSATWQTIRFDYGKNGKLVWYLNGEVVHQITSLDTQQGYPEPFNQTIREIKINLALGGRPGPLDPKAIGTQGATFAVDYIKVFPL